MTSWPRTDANLILIFEVLLMSAFLVMNAADAILFSKDVSHYKVAFSNPVSQLLVPLFDGMSVNALYLLERFTWWFHIIGILGFLNYLILF